MCQGSHFLIFTRAANLFDLLKTSATITKRKTGLLSQIGLGGGVEVRGQRAIG
jgi:hypothetical protein